MKTILISCLIAAINIVPRPREIEEKRGEFALRPDLAIVLPLQASAEEEALAQDFAYGLKPPLAVIPAEQYERGPAIFFGELGRQPALDGLLMKRRVKGARDLPPQGYYLHIWSKGIAVIGADPAGTFYGMQTLRQVAQQSGMGWPQLEIRDWPSKPWRGAQLATPPTAQQLEELAGHKINLIFFPGASEPSQLSEVYARLHMTSVPQLPFFDEAGPLLYQQPLAVEGEIATEQVVLKGAESAPLPHRHIIATDSSPVLMEVSSVRCIPGRDYTMDLSDPQAPFLASGTPNTLRRIPGGSIPSGASALATYTFAPPNAAALCPSAAETVALLGQTLSEIAAGSALQGIHWGGETIERLNTDQRCRLRKLDDVALFLDAASLLHTSLREVAPEGRSFLALDAILDRAKDPAAARAMFRQLPSGLWPTVRVDADRDAWDFAVSLERPFLPVLTGQGDHENNWALSAISETQEAQGVVLHHPDPASEAFQAGINTAW